MTVQVVGEFRETYFKLSVDGYLVPNLKARSINEFEYELIYDERFSINCPSDELQRWVWFLANAIAVSAGYSCFGENAQPLNPYRVKAIEIKEETEG